MLMEAVVFEKLDMLVLLFSNDFGAPMLPYICFILNMLVTIFCFIASFVSFLPRIRWRYFAELSLSNFSLVVLGISW